MYVATLFSSLSSSLTVDLIRYQFERVVCNPRISNTHPPPLPRASPLRVMGGLAQVFTSNSRAGIWYTVWYAPVSNFITYGPTPLKPQWNNVMWRTIAPVLPYYLIPSGTQTQVKESVSEREQTQCRTKTTELFWSLEQTCWNWFFTLNRHTAVMTKQGNASGDQTQKVRDEPLWFTLH